MRHSTFCLLFVMVLFAIVSWSSGPTNLVAEPKPESQTIRCAIIGGMVDTGMWTELAARFAEKTGHRIEVVSHGNKRTIAPLFRQGEIDLLTMHASDVVINLVADGYGINPQPWARNDLLLVGPPNDPAGIKGETDAVKALQKIISSKNKFLTHPSLGTNEVLADLLTAGNLELDDQNVVHLSSDRHREMLKRAQEEKAYTIVGRIPYLNSKINSHGMEVMVQGDPHMRRPYVVIVANRDAADPRLIAANQLATYLRSTEVQAWLKEFGKGKLDAYPLFFPIELKAPKK
jgi:tungstate transport system substrate-binding protein